MNTKHKYNHVPLDQKTRVNDEIAKLASYKVIRKTTPEQGEFVSGFFAKEKKGGYLRIILNFKSLNNYVLYKKFKMETFNKALTLNHAQLLYGKHRHLSCLLQCANCISRPKIFKVLMGRGFVSIYLLPQWSVPGTKKFYHTYKTYL